MTQSNKLKKKYAKESGTPVDPLGWPAFIMVAWMAVVAYFFLQSNPVFQTLSAPGHSYPVSADFFPFPLILFYLKMLFFDISMVFGIWGLGYWALVKLPISWDSSLERWVFEMAIGFGVTSVVMFFMGVLGLYKPLIFWVFFVSTVLLAGYTVVFDSVGKSAVLSFKNELKGLWGILSSSPFQSLILLSTLALGFVMTFVPEIFYDPLVYHLGVPNWYLRAGRILNISILYSHYTLAWQMVNLYALGLTGHEVAAKFFHLFSGILLCLGFISLLKRWGSAQMGILAGACFLTMPMTQMALWTTGNDVSVSLFAFLSIYAFLAFMRKKSPEELMWPWMLLCGVAAGFAFTTKYTSAVHLPAALGAVVVYSLLVKDVKLSLRFGIIYAAAIGVLFLPWAVKNVIYTGNPFYQFFTNIFGGEGGHPVRLLAIKLDQLGLVPAHWWQYFTLPWVLTMRDNSSLSYPGPLLLAAIPLVFAIPKSIRKEPWLIALLIYISFEAVVLLPAVRTLRYHLPQMTAVIALFSLGWGWFFKRTNWFMRSVLVLATNLCLLTQVAVGWATVNLSYAPWNVLVGAESRQAYREYTHPGLNPYPSDAAYAWMGENIPDGKVLIFGDEKGFPCPIDYYASGIFDYNLIATLADAAKTPEDILAGLRREGITHIMVNFGEARRLWAYVGVLEWTPENIGLTGLFWQKYVRLLKEVVVDEKLYRGAKSSLLIYELIEIDSPRISGPPPFNPIIYLYEDFFAQRQKWGPRQRFNFVSQLAMKWPDVHAFRDRLSDLRSSLSPR